MLHRPVDAMLTRATYRAAALSAFIPLGFAACGAGDESNPGSSISPDGSADAPEGGALDAYPDGTSDSFADSLEDGTAADASADGAISDADSPLDAEGGAPFTPDYPAQPPVGTLFWGAAIGGNSDPVARHEAPSGYVLSLRRTFFGWDHRTGYMIDTAAGDLQSARLPWVSIKTPSWADMAAGLHDDEIDEMLEALDALQGQLRHALTHAAVHGHVAFRSSGPAGSSGPLTPPPPSVALAPILMSWTWVRRRPLPRRRSHAVDGRVV